MFISGITASVDVLTGRHTVMHYLLKPLDKAREKALTER
jgi:adhesin transport system membrane fusion protein